MLEYRLTEDGVLIEKEVNVVENVMKEINAEDKDIKENFEAAAETKSEVPVKIGFWQKFKGFMLQEIDLLAPVDFTLRLTPYESKVLNEVKDFWLQDVRNDFKWN